MNKQINRNFICLLMNYTYFSKFTASENLPIWYRRAYQSLIFTADFPVELSEYVSLILEVLGSNRDLEFC